MKISPLRHLISWVPLVCALAGCAKTPETSGPGPAGSRPADLYNGRALFLRICSVCHQPKGQGVPGAFPPLAGSAIATEADPKRIVRIVLNGLQGPIEVSGKTYNNAMPAQGSTLTDKEISDVLSYVRSSWGNNAAEVTPSTVTAIRAASTTHPTFWTWAELSHL